MQVILGIKGSKVLYEILKITEDLQDGILKNLTNTRNGKSAKKEGFQSMQEIGANYIDEGILSLEEYQRTLFIS
jgi:type IV pilus assembly protein PilB